MALDFPNPATQTPVNEFSPTSTPSATTNGVTYTWDGTKWVGAAGAGTGDKFLELAGGNMLGGVTATVRTITAGAFDLATGNLWECADISVPNPSNAIAGMTGVIVLSAAPTGWGTNIKHPGGATVAPTAFPAVVPFYVQGPTVILLGKAVEGIA